MQIAHKEFHEKTLTDVSPLCKEFSEKFIGQSLVRLRFSVADVSRRELPLNDFLFVFDDYMQPESIEPAMEHLSFWSPSSHGPVLSLPLDMTGDQGGGCDGGCRILQGCVFSFWGKKLA